MLHADDELVVLDVRCGCAAGRSDDEQSEVFEVVLPTSGLFHRRTATGTATVDAAAGYVSVPGAAHRISHATAGDRCVAVLPSERLGDELGLDRMHERGAWALARSQAHHRLVAQARAARDPLDASLRWLAVVDSLVGGSAPPRRDDECSRAVERVRHAVAADPGGRWTLRALADVAGYAPHHLSRVFRRRTGMTITEYRDRLRLARAVELLTDGLAIAEVAATVGFVDHGHLTRRTGHVLGVLPSSLRRSRTDVQA